MENAQRISYPREFSEDEREEMRMENQAILARWLKKEDERRLLCTTNQSSDADSSEIKYPPGYIPKPWCENVPWVEIGRRQPGCNTGPLLHEKKDRVIRLTGVAMLPWAGDGENITGTLEVHVNGYIYTASGFRKHFYFDDIQYSFFRLGDRGMPPFLHFHMHPPLKKKKENTKGFVFHLEKWPLGQNRQRRSNISDNERLKNFVDQVHARWDTLPVSPRMFVKLEKEYEFGGDMHWKEYEFHKGIYWKGSDVNSRSTFALTPYDLIVLINLPFTVYPMEDIEIVNLSVRTEKIDMSVIFKDFKEESVLLINSIPLTALAAIKDRLNSYDVKYYVNTKEIDWKATVKNIAAFPEKFISMGGWDQFELEDCHTLAYYSRPPKRNLVVMKEGKVVVKHEKGLC